MRRPTVAVCSGSTRKGLHLSSRWPSGCRRRSPMMASRRGVSCNSEVTRSSCEPERWQRWRFMRRDPAGRNLSVKACFYVDVRAALCFRDCSD
mmetsp:Transcript_112129/g.316888  ORF Transcript_112129/g.316888 Transcript_112129/m.316888 type:complete len:93 (+) Transcript_112129:926-1204(+)